MKDKLNKTVTTPNVSGLDFPGKDVAESYHPVEVMENLQSSKFPSTTTERKDEISTEATTLKPTTLSGHQVLEQLGVSVRPKNNVLKSAPLGNLGLESSIQNLSPKIKEFINTMNNVTFSVSMNKIEM